MSRLTKADQFASGDRVRLAGPAQRCSRQFFRYLLVGGFNTVFGYSLFAVFNLAFRGLGPHAYLLASLASNLVAITVAFLGYKFFVFRTKGNYLKEWVRCLSVYGGAMLLTLACLPILVPVFRFLLPQHADAAPYLAAAIMAVVTVIGSFFGHRQISFA